PPARMRSRAEATEVSVFIALSSGSAAARSAQRERPARMAGASTSHRSDSGDARGPAGYCGRGGGPESSARQARAVTWSATRRSDHWQGVAFRKRREEEEEEEKEEEEEERGTAEKPAKAGKHCH
ncbi:unnamed protein product, partial [Prorocentrum cordatum]